MTAGMTGDGIIGMTIAGTIVGNAEKSTGAIVTDLTGESETLAGTGVLNSMTTASIEMVAVITAKDSAEAIFKPIANMTAAGDGNLWIVLILKAVG
jgi:hypothetical protein